MIYNDTLKSAYGTFGEVNKATNVIRYKPLPVTSDYESGYINRFFAKKANENIIIETDQNSSQNINSSLYKVVQISWKISGPRHNLIKNGIIDKTGVIDQNKFEIDRVKKEEDIDLSSALPNLLEYWQGK